VLARRAHREPRGAASRTSIRSSEILSAREGDILRLVRCGMSNKRIAPALTIAPETVKSHVKRIFIKLEVKSRAAAVSQAATLGLIRFGELSNAYGG
jgi:LuxR family maltose regulon positive regulatory protein